MTRSGPREPGPWRRTSLRVRLLLLGLVGLALAQLVASIAVYAAVGVAGRRALDSSADAAAVQVGSLVTSGRLPRVLPVTGSEIVQVLDTRGRVVSASLNADPLSSLLAPDEVVGAQRSPLTVSGSRLGLSSRLRVSATTVTPGADQGTDAGDRVVVVAEPVDDLARSGRLLGRVLLLSGPLLLVLLGLIAWRVIGAALRPVERLRAGAERVSGSPGSPKLPVPDSRDEIHALATTLNSMLARLSVARERERGFVADAAHELRSPLASMRLQIDVARRLGEGGEELDDLHVEVERMSTLVADLLVLARLDAGSTTPGAGPVDVRPVLEESARARRGEGTCAMQVQPGPSLMVHADVEGLARVLDNLVTNAVRHATGRVLLTAVEEDGSVCIGVEDDGPGVAPQDRERVFERFTRLDPARARDDGGAGLGLPIVRELVRGWGGEVSLTSSPAGGLRAEVRLRAST